MTPQRAALLAVTDGLSRDLPVGPGLRALSAPVATAAALASEQGALARALDLLSVDAELGAVMAAWPKAARPLLARWEQLPSRKGFALRLALTLFYLGLVLGLQLVVVAVLDAKVVPVLEALGRDFSRSPLLDLLPLAEGLVLLLFPVGLWLALGASGWKRLPGWGRHLQLAKEAALAAALCEAGAPEDVRASVQRDFLFLKDPVHGARELDVLFVEARADAERALERSLVATRLVGMALLSLLALATLLAVLGSISRLPWLS